MARQIIFIVFLFLTHLVLGQKNNLAKNPPQPPTKKELEMEEKNHHCVKKTNKPFTERLKRYPFNLAAQIQLVSFKAGADTSQFQDMKDLDSLPRLNDTVCYSKLTELKSITFSQVDKLTDILYNYGFSGTIHIGSISLCYFPRNAILFLDKNGKVFEYIEICFECNKIKENSNKISLGQMCEEKMAMLKDFFKTVGIEYGIIKSLTSEK